MFIKSSFLKTTAIASLLASICLISSCAKAPVNENINTTVNPNETQVVTEATDPLWKNTAEKKLILFAEGTPYFTIMRADEATFSATQSAVDINAKIKELTGSTLPIKSDYVKKGESLDEETPMILVGVTAYKNSIEVSATLLKNQYSITVKDNHIIIVAQHDSMLNYAINHFFKDFVTSSKNASGNVVVSVPSELNYLSDPNEYAPLAYLREAEKFTSTSELLYSIPSKSPVTVTQGGYTDGTYFYQAYLKKDTASNEVNNIVHIVKTNALTGNVIKTSGDLDLNHANDMTLNTKTNELVVVHNNPYRTKLSIINPDTLEFVRSITIPVSVYCITYNEERDVYIVGLSGGQSFIQLDSNFKTVGKTNMPTSLTTGYVTQGVTSDNDFIYFVLYKQNVITVYDWEGKFVTLIELTVGSIEPENISVVNGEIYVSCHASGGAKIFKIVPKSII